MTQEVIVITPAEMRALMPLVGVRTRPQFRARWRVLSYNDRLCYVARIRAALAPASSPLISVSA
jgi:hypothetical protein